MREKVDAAQRLGIKACRITHSTLRDYECSLGNIAEGKYELICASPEWAIPENKQFSSMINSPQLQANLIGIIIDESQLCFIW